jgi:hypothetical protein
MLPPMIQALLIYPACYDHPVGKLELVETHISWVILTGFYAYKIKKPVNPGFLDFTTLALRYEDCLEELRLNQRLASDFYLGVVPVTGVNDAPRINGDGEVIEYAVKMRQFPDEATLDKLDERGELGSAQIDVLSAKIAHFHFSECSIAKVNSGWGSPDKIARPVIENFQTLRTLLKSPLESANLAALQDWCSAEHARLTPLMIQRQQNGMIRECHGDLHLANMAWVGAQLVIFDCLEFSPALRWIDIICDIAFCYMDLLHRGKSQLASRFLNAWLEAGGDYQGVALLRYYSVYLALVRAKVAALGNGSEISSYLHLAVQLAHQADSLSLLITHGLSGSGKTTISQQMLELKGLIRLRSDVERKRLINALSIEARYTEQNSQLVYQYLARLAENLLISGWSVIVDAAFLKREQRKLFRERARQLGVTFRILNLLADPATLRERVSCRTREGRDASDADLFVLEQQLTNAQSLDEDEMVYVESYVSD